MGRPAKCSQEAVSQVCEQISREGRTPTVAEVRDVIKGGSNTTLLRFMHAWAASRAAPPEAALELPASITAAISGFVWQQVVEARAGLEARLAEARRERDLLLDENEDQGDQIEALESELSERNRQTALAQGQAQQLRQELAAAIAERDANRAASLGFEKSLVAAEAELKSLHSAAAEAASLRSQLEVAKDQIRELQVAAASSKAELVKAQLQLEEVPNLRAQIASLSASLTEERQKTEVGKLVELEELRRQYGALLDFVIAQAAQATRDPADQADSESGEQPKRPARERIEELLAGWAPAS